jgi:hypothetical protein
MAESEAGIEPPAPPQALASPDPESLPGWESHMPKERAKELWHAWQDICASMGLPPAAWTPDLERAIVTALKKYPDFELWEQALNHMAHDSYFTSPKARGWEDTLHWLVKGDHVHQVINGYQARRQAG